MRIALFHPDSPCDLIREPEGDVVHPPLGLLSLASSCVQAGHEAYVFDLAAAPEPSTVFDQALAAFQPDVVGFTTLTASQGSVIRYAGQCREKGLRVVLGGHAATFQRAFLLEQPGVDAVICGEGERPLVELLNAWAACRYPGKIAGLALPGESDCLPPQRLPSLDGLPPLDYDLIDLSPYLQQEALGMVTSRGCPYSCFFCSCQAMWSRFVTYRSLDGILAELDGLVERYDYQGKNFTFFDDTFTLNRQRIQRFCAMLQSRSYSLRWKAMTRVDRVDPALLEAMYRAGCRHVVFGIEGTTDRDLQRLNKGFNVGEAKDAIRLARNAGMITEGYFIIGYPWQERADFFRAVDRIREFGVDRPRLSCLTPYPGTHFAEHLEEYGLRVPLPDPSRYTNLLPIVETDGFSLQDQAEAMLYFVASYVLPEGGEEKGQSVSVEPPEEASSPRSVPSRSDTEEPAGYEPAAVDAPALSPLVAVRPLADGDYLAFEYGRGSFALLNRAAVEVMKLREVSGNIGQIRRLLAASCGQLAEEDIVEMFRLLTEFGFVLDG